MSQAPAVRQRARWPLILVFTLIWAGINFTEAVSVSVLPITVKAFAEKGWLIGLVLGLNPLFGFIAQPLVGLLSDNMWTRVGRRAFFLIIGAPIVAISLVLTPLAFALWQLFLIQVFYQFFEDVLYGSDHPLLADLIPPQQRSFVAGCMTVGTQIGSLFLLKVLMVQFTGEHLKYIYWAAAGLQIAFVCIPAFFLGEKPNKPKPRPKMSIKRYIADVNSDKYLRRLAAVQFLRAVLAVSVTAYVVLYAKSALNLSQGQYSSRWAIIPIISLVAAVPIGFLVERFAKNLAIAFGALLVIVAAFIALTAEAGNPRQIYYIAAFFGLGSLIIDITFKPFMVEYFPPDIIGQLSGAMNIFFAVGRTVVTVGGGFLISFAHEDYTVMWYVTVVAGIACIAVVLSIPDYRHQARKRGEPVMADEQEFAEAVDKLQ